MAEQPDAKVEVSFIPELVKASLPMPDKQKQQGETHFSSRDRKLIVSKFKTAKGFFCLFWGFFVQSQFK